MKTFKEIATMLDTNKPEWGTPEATAKAKKCTPGQKEDIEPGALKQKANAAALSGNQGLASKYMQQYKIARQRKDAQRAASMS